MKSCSKSTKCNVCEKEIKASPSFREVFVLIAFVACFLTAIHFSASVRAQVELPKLVVPQSITAATDGQVPAKVLEPPGGVDVEPATVPDYDTASESSIYPRSLVEKLNRIVQSGTVEASAIQAHAALILRNIDGTVYHLSRGETGAADPFLESLIRDTMQWDELRRISPFEGSTADRDPVEFSPVFLEEIHLALERCAILWRLALQAEDADYRPLTVHFTKNAADIQRLKEKTRDVEAYFLRGVHAKPKTSSQEKDHAGARWCEYLDTETFIVELEACERSIHGPNKAVSSEVSQIPLSMLAAFCDRANVILTRLDDPELSGIQKAYLQAAPVLQWREELARWSADTVSPTALLRAVEHYEATAGMSDMQNLFRLATRQSYSRTPELRRLGVLTRELYGLPNIRFYISKALINNHLPAMKPESAPFRETIQGQPTVGRRQAESDITVRLLPDENRLRLSLDLDVHVETSSRSNAAFATTLFNSGRARVEASREIELSETGFQLAPSRVRVVQNRLHLRRIQTAFDRVPLLSGTARGVVKNQYEARIGGAKNESQQKIARQVRDRLNKETEERFETMNEKYRDFLDNLMSWFDLSIERKDAKTEMEWLLTSWAIRGQDCLGGHTPAPETPPGSFADLKVHESIINMMVGKMQFDGKSGTVAEIRREIAGKLNRPELDSPGDNDDVSVAFADYNPIVVRFVDGKAEIAVSLKSLRIQGKTHRNLKVVVCYEPGTNTEGKLVLKRNGVISLIGCPRIGDQIALRAAFGIIFPERRQIPLTLRFLETNPDFQYLATDHCRIEKGWFAVSLVAKEDPNGTRSAEAKASKPIRR